MEPEAVPGEALSGTRAMHHHRTLRRHSQEEFPLTPKKRPGPPLRVNSVPYYLSMNGLDIYRKE
jgi:hypothetical protein